MQAQQPSHCQLPGVDMSTDTYRLVNVGISNHGQKLGIDIHAIDLTLVYTPAYQDPCFYHS